MSLVPEVPAQAPGKLGSQSGDRGHLWGSGSPQALGTWGTGWPVSPHPSPSPRLSCCSGAL